jgi:hypothetical protein
VRVCCLALCAQARAFTAVLLTPLPRPKQAKKLTQRAAKAGGSIAGYTNDSNPFGDPNLTQRWVLLALTAAPWLVVLTAACCFCPLQLRVAQEA